MTPVSAGWTAIRELTCVPNPVVIQAVDPSGASSALATVSQAASQAARQRLAMGPRLGTVNRFGGL